VNLKTYQAFTMAQALAAVKQDLGTDAIILNTRTFRRGGIMGLGAKLIVEVTATPAEAPSDRLNAKSPSARTLPLAAQKAYASAMPTAPSGDAERDRVKRLAMAMEETHRRNRKTATAPAPHVDAVQTNPIDRGGGSPKPTMLAIEPKVKVVEVPWPTAARRFVLAPTHAETLGQTVRPHRGRALGSTTNDPAVPNGSAVTDAMQVELAAIRGMVGQVLQQQERSKTSTSPAMPEALFDMYLAMVGQDISRELAEEIINDVRHELNADQLLDTSDVRQAVLRRLAAFIPSASDLMPNPSSDGRPRTIALIGPTGVGKTTTVAKLAATFKLRHGCKVGLITADTYRIAAVEQLRTYANIIGIPLQVAMSPAQMSLATQSLADCDVILIDTAGRSQNDLSRIEELKQFITAANPHEVHLVLSSTAGEKVLLKEAEVFAEVGIHRVVLTKLDEAVSFGVLVNVIRQVGKQLSFVTTGQEVPEHLECGRGERLAELVLGGAIHP